MNKARPPLITPLPITGTQASLPHQSEGEASPQGDEGWLKATWSCGMSVVEMLLPVGRWPKGGPKAAVGCSPVTWQELKKEEKKRWLIALAGKNT